MPSLNGTQAIDLDTLTPIEFSLIFTMPQDYIKPIMLDGSNNGTTIQAAIGSQFFIKIPQTANQQLIIDNSTINGSFNYTGRFLAQPNSNEGSMVFSLYTLRSANSAFRIANPGLKGFSGTWESFLGDKWVFFIECTAVAPDPPTSLQNNIAVTSGTQAGITWLDGDYDGGRPVLDYAVYYNNATFNTSILLTNVTQKSYTARGLIIGNTYNFWVTSRNAINNSLSSDPVSILAANLPDAPLNLQDNPAITTDTQIGLNWVAGFFNGGSPVIDYRITQSGQVLATGVTSLFFTAKSLQAGTTYSFSVSARTKVGYSVPSTEVTILAARPPDSSIQLKNDATLTSQTQIGLQWKSPVYNGGSPVIDYQILQAEASVGTFSVVATAVTSTSYLVTGLTGGATYFFTVQARNVKGYGTLTPQISVLCASAPSTPLAPLTSINTGSVELDWLAPNNGGSPITAYKIEIQISDGTYITDPTSCNGASSFVVSGLNCILPISRLRGPPYNLPWGSIILAKITATNIVGTSQTSPAGGNAQILTTPDAPTSITQVFSGPRQIDFNWSNGVSNGGTSVIDYRIYLSQIQSDFVVLASSVTTRNFTVQDLTPGQTYQFILQSRNSQGYSVNSTATSMTTQADVPDSPVNLQSVAALGTKSQIGLQWRPGNSSNGSPVIDYSLSYDNATGVFVPLAQNITATNFTVTGLIQGQNYTFKVSSRNAVGSSAVSTEATVWCIGVSDPPILTFDPQLNTGTSVTLNWADNGSNGGVPILDYRVSSDQSNGTYIILQTGVTTKSYNATGLILGNTYQFKMESRNQVGHSPFSNQISVISAVLPDAPLNVVSNPQITTAGIIGLEWSPGAQSLGTPLIDYTISYDQSIGQYVTLVTGLSSTNYTATNLISGKTYSFKVQSRNKVGFSAESLVAVIICPSIPDPPILNLNSSQTSDTTVGLTWIDGAFNGGLPVIDYRVSSDMAQGSFVVLQTGVTTQSYLATGLTPGKQYKFQIKSRNSLGYSAFSNQITVFTALRPDAPQNVTNVPEITSVSQAGIKWSPGASNGSEPVIDYTVSYDQSTGVFVTLASGLTSLNYTATGLAAGKTYSFKVAARSSVGLGDYSSKITILCAVLPDAPVLAQNQTDAVATDTQASLNWVEGTSNGGLPIINYRVSASESSGIYTVLADGVQSQAYVASGLKPGKNYQFKIESQNQVGYSPFSNEVRVLTTQRPDAPVNLMNIPTITSGRQAGLQWSPGQTSGSSPLLDYSVSYDQSIGVFVTLVEGLNSTSYTATGMVAGKTYIFKVNARNQVGYSADSAEIAILCVGVPDAPSLDLDDTLTTETKIVLEWADGASSGGYPIIDYRISTDQSIGSFIVLADKVTQKYYSVIMNTEKGKNYKFIVESRNQVGYSPMSNVLTVLSPTKPDAPVSISNVAAITNEYQIGIQWGPGASSGSRPLIDYTISYDQSTGVYVTLASRLKSTQYTATGLIAGKTYTFRVQARNVVGLSDFSSVATILCASIPDAPVLSYDPNLTTTSQVGLTWVDGATSGGVPILDYRVSYDQSIDKFVVFRTGGVSSKSFIATGLETGRTYQFKIESRNQVGYSLFSNQIAVIVATKPDTPLSVINDIKITNGNQIGIQWSRGASDGGSAIIDYSISYDQAKGIFVPLASNITSTSYTASGLVGGLSYSFKVLARNAIGQSAYSSVATVLCAAIPDAPVLTYDQSQVTDTQIALAWVDGASSQGLPIIDYRVSQLQSTGSFVVLQTGLTKQSYIVTGLQEGKEYSFKVESRNQLGYSLLSNKISVLTDLKPDAPFNVQNMAAITSDSQIGLEWSPGASSGSQPLIDYSISYDQATGVFVTLASNITSTSFTATGLTAGKTYSFRVQARNAVGLSAPSAVATILCAAVPNAAVLSHDLSSTTTTQIALTWVDGATRGVPIIDYRVSYDQSSNNFVVLKNGVSSKSFIATGLLTGRTYQFKIESRNEVGYSVFSNQIAVIAGIKPDTPLSVINMPEITNGTQIGLKWSPGASDGGSSIIDYSISYDQAKGIFVPLASNITSTSYIASGLVGGLSYSFKVSARNAVGSSADSQVATVLCAAIPDAPVLNFDQSQVTDTQIALTWVDGASSQGLPIIDYRVSQLQSTGSFVVFQTGLTTQAYLATELTPGKNYSFRIESRNSLGYSLFSNQISVFTELRPDAPLNLANVAAITGLNKLGLQWSPGASFGSQPLIDYLISYDQATGVFVTLASNITTTSYTATGLSGGKTYSFKVQARTSVGLSEFSPAVSVVQLGVPAAAFLSYNATLTTGSLVSLSWTDNANTGGLPILDYRITYDNASNMASFRVLRSGVTSRQFNVTTGLKPGLTYTFKIESRNALGFSPFSNIVAPTTVVFNANANVQIDTSTAQTFVNYVTAPNQVIKKPLLSVFYSGKSIGMPVGGQIFFQFNMTDTVQLIVDRTVINGGYTWVTNYQTYEALRPYIPDMPDGPGGIRMYQLDGVTAGQYKFRVASVITGKSTYTNWDSYTGDKWTFNINVSN